MLLEQRLSNLNYKSEQKSGCGLLHGVESLAAPDNNCLERADRVGCESSAAGVRWSRVHGRANERAEEVDVEKRSEMPYRPIEHRHASQWAARPFMTGCVPPPPPALWCRE